MIRLLFLLLVTVGASCSSREDIPNDVLPVKKMQQVLWDVMVADEVVEFYHMKDSSLNAFNKRMGLYDTVFSIHKISKQHFQKSLQFYQSRPDLLKIILDSLQRKAQPTTKPIQPI